MVQTTSEKSVEELRTIVVELARTELAAVTAALKFWGAWVDSATKYAQRLDTELRHVSGGSEDSQAFVGRLTDFSREYLREVVSLPTIAMEHFATEVEKISKPVAEAPPKRARQARAKA